MNVRLGIEVVTLEPTPAVVWARRVGRRSLDETVEEGIQRVRGAVTAARVPTSGPPFVRYVSFRPRLVIEMGLPLDGPHAVPTLRTTILPGGDAATLWKSPDRDAFDDLRHWVEANALGTGDPWEWYWTEPDAARPRIQIVWPVRWR